MGHNFKCPQGNKFPISIFVQWFLRQRMEWLSLALENYNLWRSFHSKTFWRLVLLLWTLPGDFWVHLASKRTAFRTASILNGILSTRCSYWHHVVAADLSFLWCSIGLRCWDCGGHWSSVNLYVQVWRELCDTVHFPAGSNDQKMVHCGHKVKDMLSNTLVGCSI